MNNSQSFIKIKKILLFNGCLVLLMILGACHEENSRPSEFEEQYFEGKSDNWFVKMESEIDSERRYIITYIGEGNKPLAFKYVIYESSIDPDSEEGELIHEDEFEINKACGGACDALSESIPIETEWEGKIEKVVVLNRF